MAQPQIRPKTAQLLTLGVLAELALFLVCYFTQPSIEEVFRHAARYSGRLSFVVFLTTFAQYTFAQPQPLVQQRKTRLWLLLIAVLHFIHFGFLATNIILNHIPIVPIKLTGGALAYLMICLLYTSPSPRDRG